MSLLQGDVYSASYMAPSALAGSTAVLTVTAPDGTFTTPTVTITGGVTATATVPAAQVGAYLLVWTVSGAIVDVLADQFEVTAASLNLVGLSDVRADLRIQPNDTTFDIQWRRWLQGATTVIHKICGPILPTPTTRVFDGEGTFVILPYRWVTSITSVIETRGITNYTLTNQPLGSSVDAFGYTWDKSINKIVRRAYGGAVATFPPGTDVVSVSFVAGLTSIPDDIQMAAIALIRHWHKKANQPASRKFGPTGEPEGIVIGNYFVPNEVLELLEPWRLPTGMF